MMSHHFSLNEGDVELLAELLEDESMRLLRETRHTDARAMRAELQMRLRAVDRLLGHLRASQAQPAGRQATESPPSAFPA
jgi:hypothetical protein